MLLQSGKIHIFLCGYLKKTILSEKIVFLGGRRRKSSKIDFFPQKLVEKIA
jgi:hypothetical protein